MSLATFDTLDNLHALLRAHLLESIVPFWTRHALDPAGGINTCIRDDGTVVSRDKWLWSQWRAVWVFAALYNRIERRADWLDTAKAIRDFTMRCGWDDAVVGWALCVDGEGHVTRGCESIYADGFAIYALVELHKALGDDVSLQWARRTADSALRRLAEPHDTIPHFPYPVPEGARVHGLPMMFSLVFWELGEHVDDDHYRHAAVAMQDEIFDHFYQPQHDAIVERIAADGSAYSAPQGTAVNPGHVIEDMWFQIHIARDRGDHARIAEAVRLIRRHCELGWDQPFGGLRLAIDVAGHRDVAWAHADTKLWWPHTEAMYALLLAHEITGEPWCIEWYRRVHHYAFTRYPVKAHGEWRQRLDRYGYPFDDVVALPVKDPFHLPRAMILCIESLERMANKT